MKETVLKTKGLCKQYGSTMALSKVDVSLNKGKIYGMIGQNGAGKTTFMRVVSGLARPTDGEVELFGKKKEKEQREERKRVGCMIEYPSLIGNMTAKENIRLHRVMKGIPNKDKEDELLRFVGLQDTGKKKAKDFSQGMKQRLGIADALIGNPELLLLDEPINGLDPLGIVEVRKLLVELCEKRGLTILISSHNLPELYQMATDYIIMHKGEIRQTLTHQSLEEKCKQHLVIRASKLEELVRVIDRELGGGNYKVMPDSSVQLYDFLDEKEKVSRILYENGIVVSELAQQGETLESYFIDVIGGMDHE